MKKTIITVLLLQLALLCGAQEVRFAFLTDNHYSKGTNRVDVLKECIQDINTAEPVDFVLFGGDITDFGSDEEIAEVKKICDGLRYPYYVVAGNHDSTWSESGCNTFKEVFGYEHFEFEKGGWRFLGCNCGPDMRMSPALLPRESMLWLSSRTPGKKTIFVNHYPQDSSELNYFDVTRQLKRIGVQWEIGGHWHSNRELNYDGIPAVLCRDTYSTKKRKGYSVVTLTQNHVTVCERVVDGKNSKLLDAWYSRDLAPVEDKTVYDKDGLPESYPWMRYDVNEKYPQVKQVWSFADDANIVSGFARDKRKAYYSTATGTVRAIKLSNGRKVWSKVLPGKVFSTPAVDGRKLVIGCSDGYIYCLDTRNGNEVWKYKAKKSVLGAPVIKDGVAYIGASDGVFRAIRVLDGSLVWENDGIKGFVVCKPYIDDEQVVFGTWAQMLYSLDPASGEQQWEWQSSRSSRMLSPAQTIPVKAAGRIYVAVPDRKVYAVDAKTGKQLFWVNGGRETLGFSEDMSTIYVKTMFHHTYSFKADVDLSSVGADGQLPQSALDWNVENRMGYDISPSPIVENKGVVLVPADKGNIIALSSEDGSFLWAHKISIALVNPMQVWNEKGKTKVLASTMDGKVAMLQY